MRWLVLLLSLAILPWAANAAGATPSPDLKLTWTRGVCPDCRTADSIVRVQFVSPVEAWAIGYQPPGEVGAGDYSILHTKDGGRTWKEYPSSYSHNDPPMFSFANRREGWLWKIDMPEPEIRLVETSDAGEHWRRLGLKDLYIDRVQDLGGGRGFAHWFDIYSKAGKLYFTADHGRRWFKRPLPSGLSVDQMHFTDAEHGLLAGCLNGQVVVLRTVDGGRRWITIQLDFPKSKAGETACALSVDDLSLRPNGHALLLVNKNVFTDGDTTAFTEALQSADGAVTWAPVFQKTPTIPVVKSSDPHASGYMNVFPPFTAAGYVGARTMMIAAGDGPVFSSDDNGAHWRETRLPHSVNGCRSDGDGLVCAAGDPKEFWVLRVSAAQ